MSTSTFSRIVLKIWICGWPRDARDPTTAHLLTGSVETTHTGCEAEVSSTAVMSMFEVSGSTSVSREGAVPADPSHLTLRVEALSPSNLSTKRVSLASTSSTFHKEVQIKGTHVVNPRTNSNAGSGTGSMPGRYADSSLAVHQYPPRTSQGVLWLSCWVQSCSSTKRYTYLSIQERGWIPAAIPLSFERTVTPTSPWQNKLLFRKVPCPSRKVRYALRPPSQFHSQCPYLAGPGDPQIGLNLITVVLMDVVWIFIFSVTFQLAFNTDALLVSPTGYVALARTASLNVVARHSEEPLNDFSTPHIGSLMGVHSDLALCFTEGVGASPKRSKMIRIVARGVGSSVPLGRSGRAHVLVPESTGSGNLPTSLTCGSKVTVVVDEGTLLDLAGHETALRFGSCLLGCASSKTQTQPFTMPIRRKKDWAINGWLWRVSVSVLG